MELPGIPPLPPGSEIELYDPEIEAHGTATVLQVRMVQGDTIAMHLYLDCEVEQRWWDAILPEGGLL